ncbi:histidine kinase [Amycolatopsis granulosa]|uniref:histidine kinase n=1 Tax=Amycolatopsis granulosa TaxID=185684 RepID=UPI00141E85DB|nr:signal transduction histidine kinase [Amycolatopsis granulosa]
MGRFWGRAAEVLAGVPAAAVLLYESRHNAEPWELVAGLVAIVLAIAAARRGPWLSLTVAVASSAAMLFNFAGRVPAWPVLLMVPFGYLAGRRMESARPALATFFAVSVISIPLSLAAGRAELGDWGPMFGVLLFAVLPWQLGRYMRTRDELVRSGWQRAEELELRQRIVAEEARLRERARIASDMHDSLGHELSLMALRAAALEMSGSAEAKALRESAGAATERLREIIGVLREDAAPVEPVDDGVASLVERARESGMDIVLREDEVSGADDEAGGRSAPPMVERAAYRVVQEALTNVTKHAPGAGVIVSVSRAPAETVVRVCNSPPPAGPLPSTVSGRRGLVGLGERVRLLGGTLSAGPRDGGFEVVARLPHASAPAPAEPVQSESARQLGQVRRTVRRRLVAAFVVPPSILAGLLGVVGATYQYQWQTSVLDPAGYEQLRPGQSRAEVAAVLPHRQRGPHVVAPEPPGLRCEYYGTGRSIVELRLDAYRLCFDGERLASKELLTDVREGT